MIKALDGYSITATYIKKIVRRKYRVTEEDDSIEEETPEFEEKLPELGVTGSGEEEIIYDDSKVAKELRNRLDSKEEELKNATEEIKKLREQQNIEYLPGNIVIACNLYCKCRK